MPRGGWGRRVSAQKADLRSRQSKDSGDGFAVLCGLGGCEDPINAARYHLRKPTWNGVPDLAIHRTLASGKLVVVWERLNPHALFDRESTKSLWSFSRPGTSASHEAAVILFYNARQSIQNFTLIHDGCLVPAHGRRKR